MSLTDWPELDRSDWIEDAASVPPEAVAAPEPEPVLPDLDLTRAAVMGRRVRISGDAVRTLGIGELAHVARLTGVPIGGLARAMESEHLEVALAVAFVLALRLEPDASWDDAQRWTLEVVAPSPADPTPRRPSS